MDKNLFVKNNSNPSISLAFCVFLDVLGFANEILLSHKNKKSDEHLNKFYQAFKTSASNFKSDSRMWETKIFTDNIVLGAAINSNRGLDDEDYFGVMITSIMEYQLSMVLSNYFIRGGWTVGELYMDENIVYGESLITAYHLESKNADVPRIIFSEDMMKMIKKHLGYYAEDYFPPHKADILKDEDGFYFVNYLGAIIHDSDNIDFESLMNHKTIVEKRLEQHKKDFSILSKYRWVAEYHNFFCETYINKCDYKYYVDIFDLERKFSLIP